MPDHRVTIGELLLALWRKTLDDDALTPEDDPLMLGATSLQIMAVIGEIAEQAAIEVPVEALFDAVTIADQAEVLAAAPSQRG